MDAATKAAQIQNSKRNQNRTRQLNLDLSDSAQFRSSSDHPVDKSVGGSSELLIRYPKCDVVGVFDDYGKKLCVFFFQFF